MKIYLSYPMSGKPDHGIPDAVSLTARLRARYPAHKFIVPHEIMHSEDRQDHVNPAFSHHDYVREDIEMGLSHCDAIALRDGWCHSTGCLGEIQYASLTGLRFFRVVEFTSFRDMKGETYEHPPLLIPMDGKGHA